MSKTPIDPIEHKLVQRFKLTKEQANAFFWLKGQNLNTDENTLCYWVKKYSLQRIKDVTNFAKSRSKSENIKNIGGWISSFLKNGLPVLNERALVNQKYFEKFASDLNWKEAKLYEKYIKDTITGDDLPLTIDSEVFKSSLEALYRKSQLYK